MDIKRIRELSGALNAAEHLNGILASPIASLAATVSIPELGDALNYAADEIERLMGLHPAVEKIRARLAEHYASPPVRDCWCSGCDDDRAALARFGVAS